MWSRVWYSWRIRRTQTYQTSRITTSFSKRNTSFIFLKIEYRSTSNNSKNDRTEHRKGAILSRAEKQYVRGIVHNLSLQRLTDQEIVDYLYSEKKIDIARSTINSIKNKIEEEAEKWYLELKELRYLYIALFKERIDTIYKVEKHLWEIVNNPKENTVDRRGALAEIHNTEKTLCALYDVSRYLSSTTTLMTTQSIEIPEPPLPLPKAIDDSPPGIGGEGAGPLAGSETITPYIPPEKKIVITSSHTPPIEEQEPEEEELEEQEEEESEADMYWRTHPDRVGKLNNNNNNKVKFVIE